MAKHNTLKTRLCNLLSWLGGASPDALAQATDDDRVTAIRTGLMLLIVLCLEFSIFSGALGVAFGNSTSYLTMGVAAIAAAIIVIIDHSIVHAHWMEAGEAMLRRLNFIGLPVARKSMWPMYVIRFCISIVLAIAAANLFDEIMYQGDIAAILKHDNLQANVAVAERARKAAQAEIDSVDAELRQTTANYATQDEASKTALKEAGENVDTQRKLLVAEIESIRKDLESRVLAAQDAKYDMNAELNGQKTKAYHTNVIGTGPAYRFAEANYQQAVSEIQSLRSILDQKQKQLVALPIVAAPPPPSNQAGDLRGQVIHDLTERKLQLQRNFAAHVNELVTADPDYTPAADGLLVRADALWRSVFANPLAVFITFSAMLAVIMLELGLLTVKLLVSQIGTYGARLALLNLTALHDLAAEHAEYWAKAHAKVSSLRDKREAQEEMRAKRYRDSKLAEKAAQMFDQHIGDESWKN